MIETRRLKNVVIFVQTNAILLFNFGVVITLNFKLSVFLFAFVLIINDVKRKKLIDIKDNLKAQSTLSLYVSVTSS